MARYLLEVPHSTDQIECARTVEMFLRMGSHYLTHADWGCQDGDHRSWVIVDAESHDEARALVPPPYRAAATVVRLNHFTLQEIEAILSRHRG